MSISGVLTKVSLIANLPLLLFRFAGGSILFGLNIWLFSGVATILAGTMGLSFLETSSLTITGAIILVMISGVKKSFTTSGGTYTADEKFKIKMMWGVGLACYGIALAYSSIGVYKTITYFGGIYTYTTFDWFGFVKIQTLQNKITWMSYSFTLCKAILAGGVDFIAGILIQNDVDRLLNSVNSSAAPSTNPLRVSFDKTLSNLQALRLSTRAEINTAKTYIQELRQSKNQLRGTLSNGEIRDLEDLIKNQSDRIKDAEDSLNQ